MGHKVTKWVATVRATLGVRFYAYADALLSLTFSVAAAFDNPLFRRARFESAGTRQEFLLADRNGERFIVITSDKALSKPMYTYGNYEFEKFEKVLSLLKREGSELGTLIDIGANIGAICIGAVKRGYARCAIAIEPEPKNYRALVSNIYLNDLADAITPFNLALGAEPDQTLSLELSASNSGDRRIRVSSKPGAISEEDRGTIAVRATSFDALIPNVEQSSHLIWMDTQGYEGIILRGAQKAIASKVPLVIEFWPYGMERANSYSTLREALSTYNRYYDLSEREPAPIYMSSAALDNLYKTLEQKGKGSFTDILVV